MYWHVLACTIFEILSQLEKLDGAINTLNHKWTLELKVPYGGKKGLLQWEILIARLYPWLSIKETSTNEMADGVLSFDTEIVTTAKACAAFEMQSPAEAWKHMDYQIIEDFGDYAYGHHLHTWDDGKRMLVRCKRCGGYILIQKSEFHGYDDDYYTDYFPVSGMAEACRLNKAYDGYEIERKFGKRYLQMDNLCVHWSE